MRGGGGGHCDMHHGTSVTARFLAVSFEVGGGENVPGVPGAHAQPEILRIWWEAHGWQWHIIYSLIPTVYGYFIYWYVIVIHNIITKAVWELCENASPGNSMVWLQVMNYKFENEKMVSTRLLSCQIVIEGNKSGEQIVSQSANLGDKLFCLPLHG